MRLTAMRFAESVGEPAERRNVTLGVIQHLWRSPVPFIGFYPPEGVKVTENRLYTPAPQVGGRHGLSRRGRGPQEGLREGPGELWSPQVGCQATSRSRRMRGGA